MELLGHVGHVESHFGLFTDSVSVGARYVHVLRRMYHRLRNHFAHSRWYSLVTRLKRKLILVHLKTMLVSVQDRFTICAKRTTGSEIIMDAHDETAR
jgi:hypothetical protein